MRLNVGFGPNCPFKNIIEESCKLFGNDDMERVDLFEGSIDDLLIEVVV